MWEPQQNEEAGMEPGFQPKCMGKKSSPEAGTPGKVRQVGTLWGTGRAQWGEEHAHS